MLPAEVLQDVKNGNLTRLAEYIHSVEYPVSVKTDDYNIVIADGGSVLAMNSSGNKIFLLPVLTSEEVGMELTLVKIGAGNVRINGNTAQAVDEGIGLENTTAETAATVTLVAVTTTKWVVKGIRGTWSLLVP